MSKKKKKEKAFMSGIFVTNTSMTLADGVECLKAFWVLFSFSFFFPSNGEGVGRFEGIVP